MRCDQINEWMSDHLDGQLNPDQERLLQEHLAGCDGCRRTLAELSQTVALLQGLPPVDPPAHLMNQLHAQLKQEKNRTIWTLFSLPQTRVAIAAGFVILVSLVGLRELYRGRSVQFSEETRPAPSGVLDAGDRAGVGQASRAFDAKKAEAFEVQPGFEAKPDGGFALTEKLVEESISKRNEDAVAASADYLAVLDESPAAYPAEADAKELAKPASRPRVSDGEARQKARSKMDRTETELGADRDFENALALSLAGADPDTILAALRQSGWNVSERPREPAGARLDRSGGKSFVAGSPVVREPRVFQVRLPAAGYSRLVAQLKTLGSLTPETAGAESKDQRRPAAVKPAMVKGGAEKHAMPVDRVVAQDDVAPEPAAPLTNEVDMISLILTVIPPPEPAPEK